MSAVYNDYDEVYLNSFPKRLDYVLSLMNIKKVRFYSDLQLSRQSVMNWKRGTIPSGETLLRIAEYLDVNPFWLLFGKSSNKESDDNGFCELEITKKQVSRIYETLGNKYNCTPENPRYYMPLQDCVTEIQLKKWELGIQTPTIKQLKEIADKLQVSVLYLINGTKIDEAQAKIESTIIQTYYCLDKENQKAVDKCITAFYAKQLYDREHKQDPDQYLTTADPYDNTNSNFDAGIE